jgi:hypothetical protein
MMLCSSLVAWHCFEVAPSPRVDVKGHLELLHSSTALFPTKTLMQAKWLILSSWGTGGCGSEAECLIGMHKALGSIPSTSGKISN